MTLLIKVLNNNLDNDLVFYGLLIGVVGTIGYSFTSKILRKSYMEKGVQTDAGENLSNGSNQIIPDNVTSIDTLSPASSTFQDTSSLIPTTSEVGIQTIAEDVTSVNKEVISNQDIVGRVVDLSNAEYIAARVNELNALDPFIATPWTPERVCAMIDTLGMVNNLFN
uniref:Uncharacterized protein n=1 Tax=Russula griseocarnosa TaxID=466936 RepID=A0A650AWJ4_9AGAM|nr:hypothetical protein [Russula griseocarnosa]